MKDIQLTSKSLKLTKSRQLWKTGETITLDPYKKRRKGGKVPTMKFRTYSFNLPIDTVAVEAISIDGKLAYSSTGRHGLRTGILGGGGRFIHTRSLYDRCVVAQTIVLKDVPYYGTKEPVFKLIVSQVDMNALMSKMKKGDEQ